MLKGLRTSNIPFFTRVTMVGNGKVGQDMGGVNALDFILLDQPLLNQVFQYRVENLFLSAVLKKTLPKIAQG